MTNRIIFVMIGIMFIMVFLHEAKVAGIQQNKFEIACKNLNGEVLDGNDGFLCMKPGSIIEVPEE
jgi:ABC-type thiamin/hydroxymethylpyrimidine transport system permease subunit